LEAHGPRKNFRGLFYFCGMDILRLKNIRIFARHGCLDEESRTGAEFLINVSMELDLSKAARTGRIEDTVDYARVHGLILHEMQKRENLLERIAYRIARRILEEFPALESVEFSLAKLHPPLPGEIEQSEVVIRMKRHKLDTGTNNLSKFPS